MQDPNMLFEEIVDITEKQLVRSVGENFLQGERYEGVQQIEWYFLTEFGCQNIRKFGYHLGF
jgi:hypothetical protein